MDLRTLQRALGGDISNGQLLCPGPDHSAEDRSLSIKLDSNTPDGFVVHSFAGDDPISCKDYIREKLGLPKFEPRKMGNGKAGGAWTFVREHIYYKADGTPHLRKTKKIDPVGKKQFPQEHWDGHQWVSGVPDGWPKLLYRLPDLLKTPLTNTVFVTEGERDSDSLTAIDLCATTAGGV
jgi:hypothetical protein